MLNTFVHEVLGAQIATLIAQMRDLNLQFV